MKIPKITFVLNQPRNPQNIGAAARGMANFGFRKLSVVKPYVVAWREVRSAVHAHEVVEKAKRFETLNAALASSHVVIGTSAGSRRRIGDKWIGLDQLPSIIGDCAKKNKSAAILFGSEKTGLSNDDLNFCHYVVRIPTVDDCPSMNLAQAVAVMAYAIRQRGGGQHPPRQHENVPDAAHRQERLPVDKIERLVEQGLKAYTAAGLLKGWAPDRSEGRIRRAFYQWNLSDVDVAMLHSLFRWVFKRT